MTPSVVLMATARTWFCPMCCCTSATSRTGIGAAGILDQQGVVDLGQMLRLELDVEDGADDLHDPADVCCVLAAFSVRSVAIAVAIVSCDSVMCRPERSDGVEARSAASLVLTPSYPCKAAAPPTISAISWVICAWRCRL